MDEKITSRENAKIKYACRLSSSAAFRRSEGRFLAEGRKLCPELARGAQLETLFYTESAMAKCPELAGLPGEHYLVEDHVADKLADVGTHQGVFGVFRTPVHTLDEVKAGGRYLALERVQDPGNVGTLLRSAAAFGFDGVILSDGCASVYAPKTLRASMGAAVRIPVIEAGAMPNAITQLRAKGITCLAAALYKSQPLSGAQASCSGGVCVVIGALMFLTELTTEPKSQTQLAREAGLTREEYRKREAAKAQRMRERDAADRARREAEARGDDEQAVQAAVDRAIADSRAGKKESIWGPGLIAVCVTWFSLGAFQSASNISIIAFATEANMKQYTGFVFACFSFSSLCGALVYGAKNWTIPLWKRFYFCLIVVNLGVGTFMFAKHLWVIMIIYLLIGVCQAPTWINGNQLMLHLVPPTRFTEGVAWMGAMNSIGSSAGSAIAGVFIDHMGSHGGFLMATVLAITSLAIAFVGFRQIKSSTETPTLTEVSV